MAKRQATVWLMPGLLIVRGAALDTAEHGHRSVQLVWPVAGSVCELDGRPRERSFVIASGHRHRLRMDEGWLLLVEPRTVLGRSLVERLGGRSVVTLPAIPLAQPHQRPDPGQSPLPRLQPLLAAVGPVGMRWEIDGVEDPRIRRLLERFDQCRPGVCLKPAHWRAAAVAADLALSESRFLHLFRREMGIAWRPYLLWRRIMCAVGALLLGRSATEAAHLAGFADSAHLSRTFRRSFGLSIRQAGRLFGPPGG